MYIVIVKFIEVIARAGFIIGVTYTLPLEAAGQFGIIVTITGLFSFALGFERHVDLQRRLVGVPAPEFDRAYGDALQLYAFQYVVLLPLYAALIYISANTDVWQTLLCVVIVVGEQLTNQVYQIALVNARFYRKLAVVAARTICLLLVWAVPLLLIPGLVRLDVFLTGWAVSSAVMIAILGVMWLASNEAAAHESRFTFTTRIFTQHKASLNHFLIGTVAILMLQFDRLTVGWLIPKRDVGIYFRHILLVSIAYQVFNIAFYNRVLPRVFAMAKTDSVAAARRVTRAEFVKVAALVALGFVGLAAIDAITLGTLFARFDLDLMLIAVLLGGAVIRVAADFNALILNARLREGVVLQTQLTAFGVGGVLLIWMTWNYHIWGAAIAGLASSLLYFALTFYGVRTLEAKGKA